MGRLVLAFRYVEAEKKMEIYLAGCEGWVFPPNKAFTVKILNWYGETVVFSATSQNWTLAHSLTPDPLHFWEPPDYVPTWDDCYGLLCQFQSREFSVGGNEFVFKVEIDGQTIEEGFTTPLVGAHTYSGEPLV